MQDKWTDTHRRNFRRFWESELGKESKQILQDLRQSELDGALTEPTSERITARVNQAAGIDKVIQTIEALTAKK